MLQKHSLASIVSKIILCLSIDETNVADANSVSFSQTSIPCSLTQFCFNNHVALFALLGNKCYLFWGSFACGQFLKQKYKVEEEFEVLREVVETLNMNKAEAPKENLPAQATEGKQNGKGR